VGVAVGCEVDRQRLRLVDKFDYHVQRGLVVEVLMAAA